MFLREDCIAQQVFCGDPILITGVSRPTPAAGIFSAADPANRFISLFNKLIYNIFRSQIDAGNNYSPRRARIAAAMVARRRCCRAILYHGVFMSIRSVVAAAVLAVGVGQVAEAATYKFEPDYDITHQFDAVMTFTSVGYRCLPCDGAGDPPADQSYHGMMTGDVLQGKIEIYYTPDSFSMAFHANGRSWFSREMHRSSATVWQAYYGYNSYYWRYFTDEVSVDLGSMTGTFMYDSDAVPYYHRVEADFVFYPPPAPVPLPAAAMLMPLGIGAFALLRKRRRPA